MNSPLDVSPTGRPTAALQLLAAVTATLTAALPRASGQGRHKEFIVFLGSLHDFKMKSSLLRTPPLAPFMEVPRAENL
jgi:hypothetical protein